MTYFLHPNGSVELVPTPKRDVRDVVMGASRYRENHSDHGSTPYTVPGNRSRNNNKDEKTN